MQDGMEVYVILPRGVNVDPADLHPAAWLLSYITERVRQHFSLPEHGRGWMFENGTHGGRYIVPVEKALLGVPFIDVVGVWHDAPDSHPLLIAGRKVALCRAFGERMRHDADGRPPLHQKA